ncbi:hypothetical protein V6N13_134272 [Hibiscus sabdariffa]
MDAMESQLKSQELQEVSLFAENLPWGMQWKGLWHLFARHGDVTEAFVAGKLSRGGKRFGFVRFRCKTDAMRTMERVKQGQVSGDFNSSTIKTGTSSLEGTWGFKLSSEGGVEENCGPCGRCRFVEDEEMSGRRNG